MLNRWPKSLLRNRGALTPVEQQRLQRAAVVVCGCGGLGGHVIENLARIGIGRLCLVDPDLFTSSNLNRQPGALRDTLGKNKAEVMAERVHQITGNCRVHAVSRDFRDTDVLTAMDLAVDCLDNRTARLELAEQCRTREIPLVHGAVDGWYGQVGVQTGNNELINNLYCGKRETAAEISVLSFTAALIASLQAAEVVKLLIGRPSPLTNSWLSVDLPGCDFDIIT